MVLKAHISHYDIIPMDRWLIGPMLCFGMLEIVHEMIVQIILGLSRFSL